MKLKIVKLLRIGGTLGLYEYKQTRVVNTGFKGGGGVLHKWYENNYS